MKKILILLLTIIALNSCEDPVPTDYIPVNYLEAALLVGQPIDNIKLMRTQPIQDTFNYEKSFIRDAEVIISGDDREFKLKIDSKGERGYYSTDDYKVKGNTEYHITVKLADGTVITGKTLTPDTLHWVKDAPETIQYPKDTVNKESKDTLEWEGKATNGYWGISVKALDTLEYGFYLDNVPNSEKNRRVYNQFASSSSEWRYKELALWGIIPSNQTPVIWNYFKWYGLHEVAIYNLDYNYLRWILQKVIQSEYDPRFSSVEGNGIGVFGSMNAIRDTFFLIKNQP